MSLAVKMSVFVTTRNAARAHIQQASSAKGQCKAELAILAWYGYIPCKKTQQQKISH